MENLEEVTLHMNLNERAELYRDWADWWENTKIIINEQ